MLQKEQKEKIIVGILVIIFVISIIYNKNRMTPKPYTGIMPPFMQNMTDMATKAGEEFSKSVKTIKQKVTVRSSNRNPIKLPRNIAPEEKKTSIIDRIKGGRRAIRETAAKAIKEPETPIDTSMFVLQGLIWGGVKNVAIISGEVVEVGDIINNGQVKKIEPGKVTLVINGQTIIIER